MVHITGAGVESHAALSRLRRSLVNKHIYHKREFSKSYCMSKLPSMTKIRSARYHGKRGLQIVAYRIFQHC